MLNSSYNFEFFSVDKVVTGASSFVSVIVKVETPTKVHSVQFGSHGNESSTLQLIKGVSDDLQKLLIYLVVQLFLHHYVCNKT